ncbi:sugar ABC transporter ATP-binding protein [Paenibacillus sp. WLX1005]|uniref:sugar ABC transporter ATP-binding protein n=1 Tax=unclassified Paenibacillus TaxID=185978 RepID=UPI003983EEA9
MSNSAATTSGNLTMTGIFKSFANVPALQDVDFQLNSGEIHALLGANGAGKSTLMKILSGAYTSDKGSILIDGSEVIIDSPAAAKKAGIQCVYQEVDTSLIPQLSVAENILLDQLISSGGSPVLNWKKLYNEADAILKRLGFAISARRQVSELTLAEKQLVLIARVMAEKARFVILDEPTAPLSIEEAERLFTIMKELKSQGIGVIFISHRLPEIFKVCDRITVMRDGRRVSTLPAAETNPNDVVHSMLGRAFEEEYPKVFTEIGEPILTVRNLAAGRHVQDVSLDVNSGEIVAIVGLVGAGKTELSKLLFGADVPEQGSIELNGKKVRVRTPQQAISAGIVLVPEERRKEGIIVKESVLHNLSLPILQKITSFGIVSGKAERKHGSGLVSALGIKAASDQQLTGYLSGGNQQKVAIGKWMETNAHVYVLDEPTKGVDVGAKRDIFRVIGGLAQQGKGILYLTCEFEEALGLADRILVMCDGRITKTFAYGEATHEDLLYYASAGREELV